MHAAVGFDRPAIGVCAKAETQDVVAQDSGIEKRTKNRMGGAAMMDARAGAVDDPSHSQPPGEGTATTIERDVDPIGIRFSGHQRASSQVEDLPVAKLLKPLGNGGRHAVAVDLPKGADMPQKTGAFGKA